MSSARSCRAPMLSQNPEEVNARKQVFKLLGDLDARDSKYVDEGCLDRFLRARDNNPRQAADMLRATLKWRREFGIEDFKTEDFQTDLRKGNFYIAGLSEEGIPILMMTIMAKKLASNEELEHCQFMCHTLEAAIRLMPAGIESWVWIMDLSGYTIKRSPTLSLILKMVKILQNHYPERMGICYLVDAPKVFQIIFKVVYRFVDPVTRDKVFFVNTSDCNESNSKTGGRPDPSGFSKYIKSCHASYDVEKFLGYLSRQG